MKKLLFLIAFAALALFAENVPLLEKRYNSYGKEKPLKIEYPLTDENLKRFTVFYPQNMLQKNTKKYPLIIFANGTLIPVSGYPGVLKHLATWGFIAVGSEELWSGRGSGTIAALKFMQALNNDKNSPFYQKIDMENIGLAGHSQGGVAVFNAATRYRSSKAFKALFTMSCCSRMIAARWPISSPYDPSLVRAPVMMTASSSPHGWDEAHIGILSTGLSPLTSMQENRRLLRLHNNTVVIARLSAERSKHAHTMGESLAYLTAWFSYYLQGNRAAGGFFLGKAPELMRNPRWQDVTIDLGVNAQP